MILDAILVVLQLTVDYSGFEVADTGVSKCFCYGFVFLAQSPDFIWATCLDFSMVPSLQFIANICQTLGTSSW